MRRPILRWFLIVTVPIVAVAVALVVVVSRSSSGGGGYGSTATQANLQTALTGTSMYYAANHSTYAGLDLVTFGQIDTGVSAVASDVPSPGPHTVSIFSPGPSTVVLAAFDVESSRCYGILSVRRSLTRPYFADYPITARVGVYYFVTGSASASDCAAASVEPAAATDGQVGLSTAGFGSLGTDAG